VGFLPASSKDALEDAKGWLVLCMVIVTTYADRISEIIQSNCGEVNRVWGISEHGCVKAGSSPNEVQMSI